MVELSGGRERRRFLEDAEGGWYSRKIGGIILGQEGQALVIGKQRKVVETEAGLAGAFYDAFEHTQTPRQPSARQPFQWSHVEGEGIWHLDSECWMLDPECTAKP